MQKCVSASSLPKLYLQQPFYYVLVEEKRREFRLIVNQFENAGWLLVLHFCQYLSKIHSTIPGIKLKFCLLNDFDNDWPDLSKRFIECLATYKHEIVAMGSMSVFFSELTFRTEENNRNGNSLFRTVLTKVKWGKMLLLPAHDRHCLQKYSMYSDWCCEILVDWFRFYNWVNKYIIVKK
jgi:hypothetical protein